MEASWPLYLPQKIDPTIDQGPYDARIWEVTRVDIGKGTEARKYPLQEKLPGGNMDLGAGRGWQRGWVQSHGNSGRHSQTVRGAERSSGGWRLTGAGNVQVGGASCRERIWVAGAN